MKHFQLIAFAIVVLTLGIGCSPESPSSNRFAGDFCELLPRKKEFPKSFEAKFDDLKDDAVLVAVNGYPLTKKVFNELMSIKERQLSQLKDANNPFVTNQLADFKKNYIKIFVDQRLLIDKARELKVITQQELEDKVNEVIRKRAEARKISIEQYMRSFPGDFKYYLYELAEILMTNRLIAKHIPPVKKIDERVVKAFQQAIADDNAALTRTNEMKRTQMLAWKGDLLAKKVNFEDLAKKYNEDEESDSEKPGYWGEFERGQFDDKRVQSAVFALKVGEISDPVEDDDGFHLIKLNSIKPPERNEKGRIIQDEMRTVSHIFVKKLPLFVQDESEVLMADLKRQMQLQAIGHYLNDIRTNGVTRIEYPHGTKLFK